jgi:hypothetical protein
MQKENAEAQEIAESSRKVYPRGSKQTVKYKDPRGAMPRKSTNQFKSPKKEIVMDNSGIDEKLIEKLSTDYI